MRDLSVLLTLNDNISFFKLTVVLEVMTLYLNIAESNVAQSSNWAQYVFE